MRHKWEHKLKIIRLQFQMAAVTVAHLKEFIKLKRGHAPANAVKKNLFETAKALID